MQIEFVEENHLDLFVNNQMRLAMGAAKPSPASKGDDSIGDSSQVAASATTLDECERTLQPKATECTHGGRIPHSPLPEVSIVSASPGLRPSCLQ
jgi:hypothetical protein